MKNPFISIAEIIRRWRNPPQRTEHVRNLTDAQLSALRALRGEPAFGVFLAIVDEAIRFEAENLLHPTATDATLHYSRGKIAGLRAAGLLVDETLHLETAQSEHKRQLAASLDRKPSGLPFSPYAGI